MYQKLTDTYEVVFEMKSMTYVTKSVLEFLNGENWNNVIKCGKNVNFKFKNDNPKTTQYMSCTSTMLFFFYICHHF